MSLMKFSSSVPVRALDKRQILPSLEWPDSHWSGVRTVFRQVQSREELRPRPHLTLPPHLFSEGEKKGKPRTSTYKMHLPDFSLTTNHLIRAVRGETCSSGHQVMTSLQDTQYSSIHSHLGIIRVFNLQQQPLSSGRKPPKAKGEHTV